MTVKYERELMEKSILRIELQHLSLRDASLETSEPGTRLLGQVIIGGIHFHVEAWQVADDADGTQSTRDMSFDADLGSLMEATRADANFQTVEIDGKDYVLFIAPHGA